MSHVYYVWMLQVRGSRAAGGGGGGDAREPDPEGAGRAEVAVQVAVAAQVAGVAAQLTWQHRISAG